MKVKTLALMAGFGSSLILAGAANADYVGMGGIQVQSGIDIGGTSYDVWRVYAIVDSLSDTVEAISGNAANPIIITSLDGAFYQNKANVTNVEPIAPGMTDLRFDSFPTIGRAEFDPAVSFTMTQGVFPPDGPGFMGDTLMISNGAWFRTPGNAATQAQNLSETATNAGADVGNIGVLIGQFTIPAGGTLDGIVRVAGNFGGTSQQFIGQTFNLPAPGALALLGLAGLAGGRRRRRA